MTNRARTMKLTQGSAAVSWSSAPGGTLRLVVTAIIGDVAIGFTAFTPLDAAAITGDADEYIIKEGATLDMVSRGDDPIRVASANDSGSGDSVVSILGYEL